MGIIGTFTGLLLCYLIPLLIIGEYTKKNNNEAEAPVRSSLSENDISSSNHSNNIQGAGSCITNNDISEFFVKPPDKANNTFLNLPLKTKIFITVNYLLISVGLFNLVSQFFDLNIFSIKIKH